MNALKTLFRETITIYNYFSYKDGTDIKREWRRTVIRGVQWRDRTNRVQDSSGVTRFEKSASVTIPLNADAGGKMYAAPAQYAALDPLDTGYWTLDDAGNDLIVSGDCLSEITDVYGVKDLRKEYPKTRAIQAVSDNTNAPILKHWKINGV
jgi:hypothetical protein